MEFSAGWQVSERRDCWADPVDREEREKQLATVYLNVTSMWARARLDGGPNPRGFGPGNEKGRRLRVDPTEPN